MAASIMQVAKTLGRLSNWSLSNLEMQKIAFIAEMLHLGREDTPLINEDWQAWSYGPVQPDLYHRAKIFGADPVRDIFVEPILAPHGSRSRAVHDAFNLMQNLTPGQMINITHQPGGAWATNYRQGSKNKIIPKPAIRAEYETLIADDDA
jgi:uncharacterized phage-associated protein